MRFSRVSRPETVFCLAHRDILFSRFDFLIYISYVHNLRAVCRFPPEWGFILFPFLFVKVILFQLFDSHCFLPAFFFLFLIFRPERLNLNRFPLIMPVVISYRLYCSRHDGIGCNDFLHVLFNYPVVYPYLFGVLCKLNVIPGSFETLSSFFFVSLAQFTYILFPFVFNRIRYVIIIIDFIFTRHIRLVF